MLPYLEQGALYSAGLVDKGWGPFGKGPAAQIVKVFVSPRDPSNPKETWDEGNGNVWAYGNYGWNSVIFAEPYVGWSPNRKMSDIQDGLSNTVVFGEQYGKCGKEGTGNNRNKNHLWAYNNWWQPQGDIWGMVHPPRNRAPAPRPKTAGGRPEAAPRWHRW